MSSVLSLVTVCFAIIALFAEGKTHWQCVKPCTGFKTQQAFHGPLVELFVASVRSSTSEPPLIAHCVLGPPRARPLQHLMLSCFIAIEVCSVLHEAVIGKRFEGSRKVITSVLSLREVCKTKRGTQTLKMIPKKCT